MPQEGFLARKPVSPASLGIAVAIHVVAIGALMMARNDYMPKVPTILIGRNIPLPPPDPVSSPQPPSNARAERPIDSRDTVVPVPLDDFAIRLDTGSDRITLDGTGGNTTVIPEKPLPVLVDAAPDSRYATRFQPPYPPVMQRQEREGRVTLRVLIGPDGRVKAVEILTSDDPAFSDASRRQALRHWRFKPATSDGVAMESWKTMTVRFEMKG